MIIFYGPPRGGEHIIRTALKLKETHINALPFFEGNITADEMKKRLAHALTGHEIVCSWQLNMCAPLLHEVFPEAKLYMCVLPIEYCVASGLKFKLYAKPSELPYTEFKNSKIVRLALTWNVLVKYGQIANAEIIKSFDAQTLATIVGKEVRDFNFPQIDTTFHVGEQEILNYYKRGLEHVC